METYTINEKTKTATLTNSIGETLAFISFDSNRKIIYQKEWCKNCLSDLKRKYNFINE